jgi:hypothetical protein
MVIFKKGESTYGSDPSTSIHAWSPLCDMEACISLLVARPHPSNPWVNSYLRSVVDCTKSGRRAKMNSKQCMINQMWIPDIGTESFLVFFLKFQNWTHLKIQILPKALQFQNTKYYYYVSLCMHTLHFKKIWKNSLGITAYLIMLYCRFATATADVDHDGSY